MNFNNTEKIFTEQEAPPITNILLGEFAFYSSKTTYQVIVEVSGFKMRWYAIIFKSETLKYVSEVWCADKYQDEYKKLKKSVFKLRTNVK
jgi:hypothetical protein